MGVPPGLTELLSPLVVEPAATALITDFDGTLSPIVSDPEAARPLDGVADLLQRLARRFGVVAVVSGRPAAFLAERLPPPRGGTDRVRRIGLYGIEEVGPDGAVHLADAARPWLATVSGVAGRLADRYPAGLLGGIGLAVLTAGLLLDIALEILLLAPDALELLGQLAEIGGPQPRLRDRLAAGDDGAGHGLGFPQPLAEAPADDD